MSLSRGLTLKRASRSPRVAPLDKTHTYVHTYRYTQIMRPTCQFASESGALNIHDFLSLFYSNFGSYVLLFMRYSHFYAEMNSVKVNPDQLQNRLTLRLGQDERLIIISCKSMHNFFGDAAHRQNERQTDLSDHITSVRIGRDNKYYRFCIEYIIQSSSLLLVVTLAMEMVCCSIASWMATRSSSLILSNSSIHTTPPSASTIAPPSIMKLR